jgi:flagellar biosynthetic protein FliR
MLLAAFVAFALLPAVPPAPPPADGFAFAAALATEASIGLAIGLLARLLVTAFELAGQIVGFQAGFAVARAFNPETGTSAPLVAALHVGLVTVIFMLVDGHHMLIRSLAASFRAFPLGSTPDGALFAGSLIAASGDMFSMGARIAAPVSGVLLLGSASIGFLNRLMPQLGIFNIGVPMTVATGLVAVMISLPEVSSFFLRSLEQLEVSLATLVEG